MNLNKNNGITLVALVITVIIMLVLVSITVYYGTGAIKKANLEDIKTNMISIKGKAKIIAEKHNFDENEVLVGTKLDENSEQEGIQQTTYTIKQELKNKLESSENINLDNLYIWDRSALDFQGLNKIETSEIEFYIIDYDSCEIYYSEGFDESYSLTELKEI